MAMFASGFTFLFSTANLLTLIIVLLSYHLLQRLIRPNDLDRIPGPWGLPIVGYFPFLGRNMHLTLMDLWKKYGNIYQLTIGSRRVVVINGQKALREALVNKHDFGGRPDYCTYQMASKDALVGLNDFSQRYRVGKKLLLKAFGNFVVERKDGLQAAAHNAARGLLNEMKKAKNKPFEVTSGVLYPKVCTIMGYICWGTHFDVECEQVKHVLKNGDEFAKSVLFGVVCDYFPWAKFLMKNSLEKLRKVFEVQKAYTKKLSEQHVITYDGKNLRDISDFFHKVSEDMTEEDKRNLHIDNDMLQYLGGGTFGAGFGTIAVTTKWALLLLGAHPEYQKKMQEELDQVVGSDKYPSFDDVNNLPYTMAVINEIYRYSCIAAVPFAHKTICDTKLCGYKIPKDTVVICNLFSAHRDRSVFPNPNKFDPERYLNEDGSLNKTMVETVIPYGLGTRRCGGEVVARLEIFTFIATIVHRCSIEEVPGNPLDPEDYKFSLALDPNPFKVIMKSRFNEW